MNRNHQVIIIGGGPAGLTAGLYTSRAGLSTLLIEMGLIGGQIVNAERVENYPGFPEGILGAELGKFMYEQATKYGLETLFAEAVTIKLKENRKTVETTEGDFFGDTIIIATGSERRKLGVPGESKLTGKGVSYCATCDGPLFKDKVVAVIGGGNAAITEALSLSKFAAIVKVIHRRNQLRASKVLQERALSEPKIEFLWDTVVKEIEGDGAVKQLKLQEAKIGKMFKLETAAVFIAIGLIPNTQFLKGILTLDEAGHIITNDLLETNISGIFAAGDVRHHSARQIVTAAGDGATAALSAERFLSQLG